MESMTDPVSIVINMTGPESSIESMTDPVSIVISMTGPVSGLSGVSGDFAISEAAYQLGLKNNFII